MQFALVQHTSLAAKCNCACVRVCTHVYPIMGEFMQLLFVQVDKSSLSQVPFNLGQVSPCNANKHLRLLGYPTYQASAL